MLLLSVFVSVLPLMSLLSLLVLLCLLLFAFSMFDCSVVVICYGSGMCAASVVVWC